MNARLGGCSSNTCERGITRGVSDMALGLTIPMRYRSSSSIRFNDLRPLCESVMPSETTVSGLSRIGITSDTWSSKKGRIDMEKSNIFPAGSWSSHVMMLSFFPLFLCRCYSWLKSQKDSRREASMNMWTQACPRVEKCSVHARLLMREY